jgi:hypothetical protein
MCFSPLASFAGGVIISGIGVATIRKVHEPSQIVFASIPVFFGVQQIVEGCLWLTLPDPDYITIQKISTYWFMIMAQVLWPTMIPLSVLFMEKQVRRKNILRVFLFMGLFLSLYYLYCLISFHVYPKIIGYHIQYDTDFPVSISIPAFVIYLIVTIIPLFVSSIKRTHLLGILMFSSCLITAIFFKQFLTSVWCFFAALISGVIFWILHDSRKKFNIERLNVMKIFS